MSIESTDAMSSQSTDLDSPTGSPGGLLTARQIARQQKAIIAAAGQAYLSTAHLWRGDPRGFSFPADSPIVWVKYSYDRDNMMAQARTQDFVFREFMAMGTERTNGVRVPEVFGVFEGRIPESVFDDVDYVFIVMEYVPGVSIKEALSKIPKMDQELRTRTRDRVADALSVLLDIAPPPNARPGPVGGGLIRNVVFARQAREDESDAPREFRDLKDLEDYVNRANKVVSFDHAGINIQRYGSCG
jgi:hypothetical protein